MSESPEKSYVSRAGRKLEHALDAFGLDVAGLVCADFGCNIGGFTDCLLQRGASRVHAIDTGYGTLAYRLRTDDRVIVRERTNALHAEAPAEGVDLVAIDMAWTPQRHAIPAALRWIGASGRIVTLVKPHYELLEAEKHDLLVDGALAHSAAPGVLQRVLDAMPDLGATVLGHTTSPVVGGKSGRRGKGNIEYLVLVSKAES